MPPSMRAERQPYASTRCAEAKPPSADPTVNPQNIVVTRNERRSSGQYSEVRVTELGIAPPRPRPVRKRNRTSSHSELEYADARQASPKNRTHTSRMFLRPNLSASGPNRNAPAISPARPAPKSGASWAAVGGH